MGVSAPANFSFVGDSFIVVLFLREPRARCARGLSKVLRWSALRRAILARRNENRTDKNAVIERGSRNLKRFFMSRWREIIGISWGFESNGFGTNKFLLDWRFVVIVDGVVKGFGTSKFLLDWR